MREILFRGKSVTNGEWVYGDLIHMDGKVYIGEQNSSAGKEVAPNSVGQFTGLYDSNGEKIFEGDVIMIKNLPHTDVKVLWNKDRWQTSRGDYLYHYLILNQHVKVVIKKEDKQ